MLRRLLSAGLVLAATTAPVPAREAGKAEGLEQIEALIGAALTAECTILPLVDPPALIARAFEIDEPPEGDLAIEIQLSLTTECSALAAQALQAVRDQLAMNGLRAIRILRSGNVVVVYYG
ncbi:MAG: hypothetical protein ACWA6X_01590 [Bauldia sp.]